MTTPLDRFTNLPSTTLSGGINSTDDPATFTVTSATGFPVVGSYRILIANELLQVTSGAGTGTWVANRAVEGTAKAAHIAGDAVTLVVTAFEFNSFRQEYNAIAYGGVGDGSANEVTALQNAVNDAHAQSGGGIVFVPMGVSGTWKLNSNLTTYSNVAFLTSGAVFTGTGAGSVAPLINMSLSGTVIGQMLSPSGLTGATSASRYVGATTTGSPVSGTFAKGDWIVTQDGRMWICTTAGSPGTWQQPAPPLTFGSASDIANLAASSAAGSSGKVADASHVHSWSGLGVLSVAQTWTTLQTYSAGITVSAGGINVTGGITGTLQTAAQPNITSVGTLTGLTSGDITTHRGNSTGVIYLGNQSGGARYLYYDGTSYNLPSAALILGGALTVSGTISGVTTLTATTLAGTLSTAAQPNVTSLGTLTSLTLSGTLALGSNALTKTRNASDTIPVINAKSPDSVPTGVQLWIGPTDPAGSANEGDVWIQG